MKLVVVSHGDFAQGAYDSLKMICGEVDLEVISMKDDIEEFETKINNLSNEELIIFADIPGGHPFNTAYKYILNNNEKQIVLGGFNLPLLIETSIQSNFKNIDELYSDLKINDIQSIVVAKNWN